MEREVIAALEPGAVDAYLHRIAYDGPTDPTPATLRTLHVAHLYAVPFENLDINLGRPIVLDIGRFYDKVVRRGRGGFCYELNGLFAALLAGLGFPVRMLSARVYTAEEELTPEFDHMTLAVTLDQEWLADVGFGDSFVEPLRLGERGPQHQHGRTFRLVEDGERIRLQEERDDDAEPMFSFTRTAQRLEAFGERCHWLQTDPTSGFVKRRTCSIATPTGRVTFATDRLIVTEHGERTETPLPDEAAIRRALAERFGVNL